MTTVLRLETMAYNRLLNVVQKDLCRLEAALQGHIVMSVEVEAAFEEVQKGKLPSTWETYSYPTESMLNDYLEVTKKSSRLAKKISTKHITLYVNLYMDITFIYLQDLSLRFTFLNSWVEGGGGKGRPPSNFWLSGFFYPSSYLTAVLQNYARGQGVTVNSVCFKFEFLDEDELVEALKIYDDDEDGLADDGSVLIHGLYLQGASWDNKKKLLVEAKPKV